MYIYIYPVICINAQMYTHNIYIYIYVKFISMVWFIVVKIWDFRFLTRLP
jgi:hypothetical protein